MHYSHTPQNTGSNPGLDWLTVESSLLFLWDACLTDPTGGAFSYERAKKHLIAADRGELKATFGPRLMCASVQEIKQ